MSNKITYENMIRSFSKEQRDKMLALFSEVDIIISVFDMEENIKKLFDFKLDLSHIKPIVIFPEEQREVIINYIKNNNLMSNKQQFEELIETTSEELYEDIWMVVGPLQFNPAFRGLSNKIKHKFLSSIHSNDIKESISNDDVNIFDEDPEKCRQIILDNVWRIHQKE